MPRDATVEHSGLLPAMLVPDPDAAHAAGRPLRRSARDWIVDVVLFLACIGLGMVFVGEQEALGLSGALLTADVVCGVLMCLGLWVRRRWPIAYGAASVPAVAFSSSAGAASVVALFTVAVHRGWRPAAAIAALQYATLPIYLAVQPEDPELAGWVLYVIVAVVVLGTVAWGLFVRARRQLVRSLRERARQAEAEQGLRVEQARDAERRRIAREMHDVLAHRISLLSMHAGALEFRPDAPPEEIARAAGVIRASAHQALEDLRTVIGVLREGGRAETRLPEPPQPTLAALPGLVAESRAAGMRVRADCRVGDLAAVPDAVGRGALRIVQEALTNARKHAPGTAVEVTVGGGPGQGLTIDVRNPVSVLAGAGGPEIPGAGTGLVGLRERAILAGGRLEHGFDRGDFRLRAWLPWPA